MLFMMGNGLLFNLAVRSQSVGLIYVSAFASFYMLAHLRGSLIVWTDFYTIPYWILSYLILRKLRMPAVLRPQILTAGWSGTAASRGSHALPRRTSPARLRLAKAEVSR
jgi:hypothetical protein